MENTDIYVKVISKVEFNLEGITLYRNIPKVINKTVLDNLMTKPEFKELVDKGVIKICQH